MASTLEHTLFDELAEVLADLSNSENRFLGQLRKLRMNPSSSDDASQITDPTSRVDGGNAVGLPLVRRDLTAPQGHEEPSSPSGSNTEGQRSADAPVAGAQGSDRLVASNLTSVGVTSIPTAHRARTLSRDYDFFSDLEEKLRQLADHDTAAEPNAHLGEP